MLFLLLCVRSVCLFIYWGPGLSIVLFLRWKVALWGVSSFSYSATSNDHVMDCGHLNVQTASGGWPSLVSQSVSHSQQQDMDVDYPNGNISTRNNSSCRTGEAAARNIICEGYRYRSAPRDRILLRAFLPGEATTDWFSAFAARISNNFNNMRQAGKEHGLNNHPLCAHRSKLEWNEF